ncbi:Helix-turn-helix [Saccharopolyspora antimicrobica]|uniref:Helix-turn-helix n=1 Tax=Saccharopolyspora antimicrobica TaxID=455193 RepID=A0A1I5C0C8_9PSEU|nr:XRE family transcriptional regulator [Saccharopolyspora antimicrobica]RKT89015.1 XRE family transcriptional regulator [Saccharopolyspora antimicrobica]SFN80473.1 Helix-turn-helix [Saccharopolyspora antimicrobica]
MVDSARPAEPAADGPSRLVGAEIKRIRAERGLTLRDLAQRCGLSPGFLSLVERGINSISLTSLFALANALDVDAVELLGTAGRRSRREYSVARHDDPDATRVVMGEREHRVLTANLPDQHIEALVTKVHPTTEPSPVTQHDGEEFCYVLRGELTFLLPDETAVLAAGDSIHFKSRIPHAIHNRGTDIAEVLWTVDRPMLRRPDGTTR